MFTDKTKIESFDQIFKLASGPVDFNNRFGVESAIGILSSLAHDSNDADFIESVIENVRINLDDARYLTKYLRSINGVTKYDYLVELLDCEGIDDNHTFHICLLIQNKYGSKKIEFVRSLVNMAYIAEMENDKEILKHIKSTLAHNKKWMAESKKREADANKPKSVEQLEAELASKQAEIAVAKAIKASA